MKKLLISVLKVVIINLILATSANCQIKELIQDPGLNFYETIEAVEYQLNSMSQTKQSELASDLKRYDRWKYFWQSRVTSEGEFNQYPYELKNYYDYYSSNYVQNTLLPEWENIGPKQSQDNMLSVGGEGIVRCIWADPNDNGIIFIGTNGGGLWKTINNGNTWSPVANTTIHGGVMGIAVDETTSPITMYVITGIYFHSLSKDFHKYATGIYKSTDGGNNFTSIANNLSFNEYTQAIDVVINPVNKQELLLVLEKGLYKTLLPHDSIVW